MFQVTALQVCVVSFIFSFNHLLLYILLFKLNKANISLLETNYHFMMTGKYFNYFEICFTLGGGAQRRNLM